MSDLRPARKTIRIPEHSYRDPGAYFVTICAFGMTCLFGDVVEERMVINDIGRIAETRWRQLCNRWPSVSIDDYYVVMPNHLHGIVTFDDCPRDATVPRLTDIVARYKAEVTSEAREYMRSGETRIWQPRFYDRVVRDDNELARIREYIENNPAKWAEDEYYGLR